MTVQRRRGQIARVCRLETVTDRRGNRTVAPDREHWTEVRAAFVPDRSSRAEVPGQQQINVWKMIVAADTPDVYMWNVVQWNGREWDIAAPPELHYGTRRTRHYTVLLRERP